MTLEIFLLKGIDLLGKDVEDSSEDEEASDTDDTDKLTSSNALKIARLLTILIKGCEQHDG